MIPDEAWRSVESYEQNIARVLEIRNQRKRSRWWESPGLTAIASSLVGALIAFVGSYSLTGREAELQRATARLEQTQKTIVEANELLAAMLKMNEERYLLARGEFDRHAPKQRQDIARATNSIQQQWRQQRENVEVAVLLAFAKVPAVSQAWSTTRDSMEQYTRCIETAYRQFQRDTAPPAICSRERQGTVSSVGTLRVLLRDAYLKEAELIS
jgi:hypothetical protein